MKYKIVFFIVFIITFFSPGCEQTIDGIDLPYEEMIVLQGTLEAGKPVKKIFIAKTLPPLEMHSLGKSELKDAEAFIYCNGKKYPLKHTDSNYYDTESLTAESGKKYKIIVNWNGMTAWSETNVPFPVNIDTLYYTRKPFDNNSHFELYEHFVVAEFIPNDNAVYLTSSFDTWTDNEGTYTSFRPGNKVYRPTEIQADGKIHSLHSRAIGPKNNIIIAPTNVCVDTYDAPFYDYFITKENMYSNASDFLTKGGGKNVIWNVSGKGIGLFIGKATTIKRSSLYKSQLIRFL